MSWFWKPYVSAAQRRASAQKEASKLSKKGQSLSPVLLEGRKIASSFWGKGWCDHLESYSDFSNRLPRGRTYVRNGSVIDLQVSAGMITALVSGSSIYKIKIGIKPLAQESWSRVQKECAGKIDSLIELLQGKLSSSVMEVVSHRENGLFPKPAEISMECSCPDWAGLCKHLAACLYGIGARLDRNPDLLFTLRGVNPGELISAASAAGAVEQKGVAPVDGLGDSDLSSIFGIEIDTPAPKAVAKTRPTRRAKPSASELKKKTGGAKILAVTALDQSTKGRRAARLPR
ncbi:MAG: SWIM zinc finger family protein [Limisphaerales bacterium]